ncbi:FHF complex subunit HOOK interacting protein 2B [Clupea harengus]|uniref:FHF complex subunit HOOK interacting protein 2B n=1 Tax=Clupea harengus TaxID=7950 RepID=A0A6P3VGE1_CLUHA|nr:FHF complex subunit HOOK interacting protein 2B [Clupea harengus]
MDMLSKLTNLFQQALETREPLVNLLDSFVDHWKGITNYYIETTDEYRPVKQTDIPWRLKQMLDILVYEEQQQQVEDTGPCLEYLLQHKLLETLCTLGKAQYPPGMSRQVLLFFSKFLTLIQKPLLHIINVYRPVQKLIRLCGLPNAQTEKEEALFLFTVCSRVNKDPYVLNYILEVNTAPTSKSSSSSSSDEPAAAAGVGFNEGSPMTPDLSGPQATSGLIQVLLHLSQSQSPSPQSRVRQRALESVRLLAALPGEDSGALLAAGSPLCELLAQRLCELYSLIPSTLDPADVQGSPLTQWREQFTQTSEEERPSFPGSDHLTVFLCWLDYCQELLTHAPKTLSVKLAKEIHRQWLSGLLQPQLLQMSEAGILLHTALLSCSVRHTHSAPLLAELVPFLLGSATHPERPAETNTDTHATLRYKLIQHCDHISDEISIATLRLFEELLQKPDRSILGNLMLRNLAQHGYATPTAAGCTGDERHVAGVDALDESDELEEDPFFSDSEFGADEPLLSLPKRQEEPHPSTHTQVSETVNSFLCLVPQEAKSSHQVQGAGYDTYVHDAHKMFKDYTALSLDFGWPATATDGPSPGSEFYEGHFLQVLFDRIARILEQPYELNLQVTSVLSKLAAFPHPHLHEYLLDPYISLTPGARSLFSTLVRVIGELMQRIQHIPEFTEKLVHVRRQLMGLEDESMMDHVVLLRGVIVLEEFCKELAAIAFVKLPMEEQ